MPIHGKRAAYSLVALVLLCFIVTFATHRHHASRSTAVSDQHHSPSVDAAVETLHRMVIALPDPPASTPCAEPPLTSLSPTSGTGASRSSPTLDPVGEARTGFTGGGGLKTPQNFEPSAPEKPERPATPYAPAATTPKPQREKNERLNQEMVLIPAGDFVMGFEDSRFSHDELHLIPRQTATSSAFWIDRYETTNSMYEEFLAATHYEQRSVDVIATTLTKVTYLQHWDHGHPRAGTENQPVRWVSYEDASSFAKWAGKRLPTNAEWEKAARGTDGRRYPWGDDYDRERYSDWVAIQNGVAEPSDADANPTGNSPYGIFNMHGNILEWTSDETPATVCWPTRQMIRASIGWVPYILLRREQRDRAVGFRCARDCTHDESVVK